MKISVRKKMLRLRGTAVCAALAFVAFSGIPARAQEAGEQTASQQAEVSLHPPTAQTLPAAILPQAAAVAAGPLAIDGDELKVYVAVAVAQGSAELDHINIQFTNTQNDRSVTKILRPEDFSEGVYADWISMSIYEPAGTYILDRLILQDENGAYVRYCRAEDREEDDNYLTLPFTAAFQIDNGVTVLDETAPVLGAVAVSPVQAGKKTEITVAAAVAAVILYVLAGGIRFAAHDIFHGALDKIAGAACHCLHHDIAGQGFQGVGDTPESQVIAGPAHYRAGGHQPDHQTCWSSYRNRSSKH